MEETFHQLINGQGMPFVMACIAIAWMQRNNNELITRLNDERNGHLKALDLQIDDLKNAIAECDRDRKELWLKIAETKTLKLELERLKQC